MLLSWLDVPELTGNNGAGGASKLSSGPGRPSDELDALAPDIAAFSAITLPDSRMVAFKGKDELALLMRPVAVIVYDLLAALHPPC